MSIYSRRVHEPVVPDEGAIVVREVRAYVIGSKSTEEACGGGADCHSQSSAHWILGQIATPMSVYANFDGNRKSWGIDALGSLLVQVELSNGIVGVGLSVGGPPACYIVEHHLSRFVEGRDPRNVELIWDQMWRATVNYGRKGLPVQALSAVDLALWDALGKLRNEPVYMLLGGMTKQRLPVYSTTGRPDLAQSLGFVGAKFPLPHGPADGDEGMRKNIEEVAKWRQLCGPDFPLMVDCYMALDLPYALELCRRCRPYNVKWVEECLMPDDYEGYAALKRGAEGCLITCGEHEYTRYGFKRLIEMRCTDILQPDITWMGGITEARRVVALAAAHDLPVIPHGSSVFSYHLQMAFQNCPMAELINLSPAADRIVPLFGSLFLDEPLPVDGYITLDPKKPGFGVTLNPEVPLTRPYTERPYQSLSSSSSST